MPASPRRALVAIDVQNEYFDGGLPIEHPAPDLSLRNVVAAAAEARAAGIPLVIVQNSAPAGSPIFAKGSAGWQLHPAIAGLPREHYVDKSLPSAFRGTDLADWIAQERIDTLTLAGYMTHNCIAATAFDAAQAGLSVEVLSDATGSVPYANGAGRATARSIHETFCVVLQSRFAAVLPAAGWIELARLGEPARRETIYGSNRAARRVETA